MTTPEDVESLLATLLQLGVNRALVASAREILGAKPNDLGEWNELAVALRKREEYDAAVVTYDTAIRRFSDSHVLWSNRGFVFLAWELYEEALKSFAKALEIKPDYVNALALKAATYERLHEFQKAATAYREVLETEPKHAKAWNSLGACLHALGAEEEAIESYEKSIQADPAFTDPLFNLAALCTARREYAKALPFVFRLLEIDPHDYRAERLRDEILKTAENPSRLAVRDRYEKRIDTSSLREHTGWSEKLYRPDGSRRPDSDVVSEWGKIGLRLALLHEAIHRRARAGRIRAHYPLRMFLSYKWGSTAENDWVARLAQKLAERRWEVVFDGYRDETVDRSVEEFVSRIVTCRVFLAIATPQYVAHAINPGHNPTWVFDEYQAALIADEQHLYCIALTPAGQLRVPPAQENVFRTSFTADPILSDTPPIVFEGGSPRFDVPALITERPRSPRFDEIHAIPTDEDLDDFLDRRLKYEGPVLNESERSRIVKILEEVTSKGCDLDAAVERLRAVLAQYPYVFDAWRVLVLTLTKAGRLSEAVDELECGLRNLHPWDGRLMLERERVDILNQLGRSVEATQAALRILKTRPADWVGHFYVGNRLDDCDELWGARNHLLISCNQEPAGAEAFNTLGVVYLRFGFVLRARQCFEAALQRDANLERAKRNLARSLEAKPPHDRDYVLKIDGPGTGCTICPAMYPMSKDLSVLCAACGGRRPMVGKCPYCANERFVQWLDEASGVVSTVCPTCRIGSLTTKPEFNL